MISKKLIWGIDKNIIWRLLRACWLILKIILAFNFKMWYNKGVVKISKGVKNYGKHYIERRKWKSNKPCY